MSTLRLKNTYTNQIEAFEPLDPAGKTVTMYSCGPTVYSYQHIGNFRSFLVGDLLRRVLELHGYAVRHVMNITDVGHMTEDHVADASGEDKLSKAARELGTDPYTVADHFERAFASDAVRLKLKIYGPGEADDASVHPRATRHVPEMLDMIQTLIDRGYAYTDSRGQVYFEIARFSSYGRLSGKVLDELEAGARVAVRDEKKDPRDFALWKADDKHLMQWDPHGPRGWEPVDRERFARLRPEGVSSAIKPGFPGWHIECSAMSSAHLGPRIDIHTGGEDNIFPHHECEIAQSHGVFGGEASFARYWVHGRHLLFDHHKMSKREGTLFTVRDILDPKENKSAAVLARFEAAGIPEGRVSGSVLRYALMSNPYTQPMNFTFDVLAQAQASILRVKTCYERLVTLASAASGPSEHDQTTRTFIEEKQAEFLAALDDNLNVPNALAVVFGAVSYFNSQELGPRAAVHARDLFRHFDRIFDVLDLDQEPRSGLFTKEQLASAPLPAEGSQVTDAGPEPASILAWVRVRQEAKAARDFRRSDEIRDTLKARGVLIEDVAGGVRWKLK